LLRDAAVPFVLFGRQDDETNCAWFDILGEEAMCDAVRRLHALGHRRIGYINGGTKYAYAHLREDGFRAGMQDVGLEVDDALIIQDAVTSADGAKAAAALLDHPEPPTAIVCGVDFAALGAYQAAAARNLSVGRDLSIIGYDGIPEGAHATPPLTTYQVDNKAAGERLSSLLIRRVRGEPLEDLRETALASFVERGSIGPVPDTSNNTNKHET
ncbi:MAG: substrate-binding domain-containing protein, partial [Marinomonas sp.]